MTSITIQSITDHEQMAMVEQLEQEIWGISDLEVTCVHSLHALVYNGGALLGAFAGSDLVGFVLGVPALTDEPERPLSARLKLYSYMAGVRADYQAHGIGRRLKLAQREDALRRGFRLITWTYDPLESLNGNLNIGKLGAVCRTYHRNFHGDLSGINAGLPTDRFDVDWWLESERVVGKISGEKRPLSLAALSQQNVMIGNAAHFNAAGLPVPPATAVLPDAPAFLMEIPANFRAVKQQDPALAAAWRTHTRTLFEAAFAQNYTVTDFVYDEAENGRYRACYVLTRDA